VISGQLSVARMGVAVAGVLCFVGTALRAETIDRIAVSVGNRVITTSDLERQIRVSAFLSGTEADFSGKGKRAMADRLVAQRLIQNEIEMTHYADANPAGIEPALREFIAKYFKSDAEYQAALAKSGITEQGLRDELLKERTVNEFIDVRFHPAVQVTEEQIQEYFEKSVAPAARASAAAGETVTLDRFHDQIERTLTGQQVDAEVERWMREARRRTTIVYHDEALL
jgi:peptidyl-prolyl cis-trans isomerase SurA